MNSKIKLGIGLVVTVGLLLLLKDPILNAFIDSAAPEDISTTAHKIEYLFNYTTILNLVYFALVCFGIFGFSYLYHYKNHPRPYYTYGNKRNQIWVVTGIGVAVFLSIDLNITRLSNNDLLDTFWAWPDPKEEKVVRIEVLGQQWAWNFRYPGADGVFNTSGRCCDFK